MLPDGRPALVLSGGGTRGAYEVGVVAGIVEALGLGPGDAAPFQIFAGTSVGAINAAFLAANAHRGDMGIGALSEVWASLEVSRHLRLDPLSMLSLGRVFSGSGSPPSGRSRTLGRSLLDPRPIEELVGRSIAWERLHANVDVGVTAALLIAALDVATGRTTIFCELGPGVDFRPSRDPRRQARADRISREHVLASAAIPALFPARRVGGSYYCDGGLRFNTPIAPAIRAGAERMVVITLTNAEAPVEDAVLDQYPSAAFLAGKVLDALLIDPVEYDLQVLHRFNQLAEALDRTLSAADRAEVDRMMVEARGAPYRKLDTLVFRPSRDIGRLAATYLSEHLDDWDIGRIARGVLRWALHTERWEADWASYILYDGLFASSLIDMGREDARARSDDIRAFFSR